MKYLYKRFVLIFLAIIYINFIRAQNETVSLWSTSVPNSISNEEFQEIEVSENGVLHKISNVVTPTLTLFSPNELVANRTAVLICPGGGYSYLSIQKEGLKVAKWLNTLGITAFVLKYRLPSDLIMENKSIGPLQDAQEAMRYIRRNAAKWELDTNKIGVIGFSAGGHLASTLSTQYNKKVYDFKGSISAKPNFSMLIYPVVSMDNEITHKGSKVNLIGESPTQAMIEKYSNDLQVNSETPKTFLVHATDDKSVQVENTLRYYEALRKFEVPVEVHIFQKGGHGFGLGVKSTSKNWTFDCENWLRENDLIEEE